VEFEDGEEERREGGKKEGRRGKTSELTQLFSENFFH
jgi:hypothetical protein